MAADDFRKGLRPAVPFSSVVGNEDAKRALECALVSPNISSVLICGPTGSGKSVIARSVASISGDREVIVLPLNATEDQIFGGMDAERTIRSGKRAMSDSILVRSDGNILLVEDINLMPEHMTHQILNAAGTRSNTVEREGISVTHGCEFLLVATMNPEGGTLSDHLLDRFDICVFTSNSSDESFRGEVVRRRIEMESDPVSFRSRYGEEDGEVRRRIDEAAARVRFTRVPDGYCGAISSVCNELGVAGHRGDISVMNASCAIAALEGRDDADMEDLRLAAAMCLEHRRNDPAGEPPEPPPDPGEEDPPEGEGGSGDRDDTDSSGPEISGTEDAPEDPGTLPPPAAEPREQVFSVGEAYRIVDYLSKERRQPVRKRSGKHTASVSRDGSGRCIGYRLPKGRPTDIAICPSIRAAAPYQRMRPHGAAAVVLRREDLREKVRQKKQGNHILFLVDGSGSIGAQKRMVAVKGAILSMLKDAYQKRDEIGMAVFRADRAEEILPLTRSTFEACRVLAEIPTGGRTPLTHGLLKGYEILGSGDRNGPRPVMVILSDGRCNVPYTPGTRPAEEMLSTARSLSEKGIRFVVIDTECGRLRFGLALELCRALKGTYLRLEDLSAERLEGSVRMAVGDARV